ncbi:MAG TPA: hypothetical protein VG944_19540 [Fimbriimonas sp.]|nr:hypothetical protein [Fimbriimonas sp.]
MSSFGLAASLLSLGAGAGQLSPHAWTNYGGNSQHQANASVPAAPLQRVLWSAPLDDNRAYYGDEVLIHYASPVITSNSTVIHSYRYTTQVNGAPNYDNWRVVGRNGRNGLQRWFLNTDYSAPVVYPSDWTSVFPLCITGSNSVAAAAGGGTVMIRANGDGAGSPLTRVCFYSGYANYAADPASFANIKICTPLTGDANGDVWFGYAVLGSLPSSVATVLGTGGVARITTGGGVAFRSVSSLGVSSALVRPALNAAPVLSMDGSSVYFALVDGSLGNNFLVKLDSATLAEQAAVHLDDPSVNGGAGLINESSAAPMVGPDGHVFMGVFGYFWRESHGWMLQFDKDLNQTDSHGKRFPVGAFGWDDTPSVVPAGIVPSYTGAAPYLLLCKYNNYALGSGDGKNKVAVLDPTADDQTHDRQTGIPTMNEVLTVVGVTPDQETGLPGAVREWCINSAAIDLFGRAAIINSEDGHCYRWSFSDNKLTEGLNLQPATGEAYTSTAIGPDGTCYAINNSILFAMGAAAAFDVTSAKLFQGASATGNAQSLAKADGNYYSIQSSQNSNGDNVAGVQASFSAPFPADQVAPPLYVSVNGKVSSSSISLQIFAKNVKTGSFDLLQTQPFSGSATTTVTLSSVANYVNSSGAITVVARAMRPKGQSAFTVRIDQISVASDQTRQ